MAMLYISVVDFVGVGVVVVAGVSVCLSVCLSECCSLCVWVCAYY
jgi:hypothetical protein